MLNPEIGFIGDTSKSTVLGNKNANVLATVSFIRENCFALEFYAFEKSNRRLAVVNIPACQYHIQKLHSLVDKDVDFGVFAAPRRPDCKVASWAPEAELMINAVPITVTSG